MITIYHNNRCTKSRCAWQALEATGRPFETVEYLKTPPDAATIREILQLLGKKPLEIIRQKEPVFKELFQGQKRSDDQWIDIMVQHPVLIERPIVVSGDKAWIVRDDESLAAIAQLG